MFNIIRDNLPITKNQLLNATGCFVEEEGTVLLFSGGDFTLSNRSFLFLFPFETIIIDEGKGIKTRGDHRSVKDGNPWDVLENWLPMRDLSLEPIPEWVGYFCYELGAYSDPQKSFTPPSPNYPLAYFQRSSAILIVDHRSNTGTLLYNNEGLASLSTETKSKLSQLEDLDFWEALPDYKVTPSSIALYEPLESQQDYESKVNTAKELIYSGEIYQVNLSQQLTFNGKPPPYSIFYSVAKENPAPFSAFLNLPNLAIASSSPERLLLHQQGFLETRPIKGTAPRGTTKLEDEALKHQLITSIKERAELMMITDLMRHDLGRISQPGTVKVNNTCAVETYKNVFHMLSIIHSKANPNLHPLKLFRACFPGGSITGCPKLRAMEVINELEQRPRGVYTGSIGYFALNGDFDFNIAIRTAIFTEKTINIQLGGGIVADSIPSQEYVETWHKGSSLLKALTGTSQNFHH